LKKWRAIGLTFSGLSIIFFLVFLLFLFFPHVIIGNIRIDFYPYTQFALIPLIASGITIVVAIAGLAVGRTNNLALPPELEVTTETGRKLQIVGYIFYAFGVFIFISGLALSYYSSNIQATSESTGLTLFLNKIIPWIIASIASFIIASGIYVISTKKQ
jgi:hypothetical protein